MFDLIVINFAADLACFVWNFPNVVSQLTRQYEEKKTHSALFVCVYSKPYINQQWLDQNKSHGCTANQKNAQTLRKTQQQDRCDGGEIRSEIKQK